MIRGDRDLSPVLRHALQRAQAGLVRANGGWISLSDCASADEIIRPVTVSALEARGLVSVSKDRRSAFAITPSRRTA